MKRSRRIRKPTTGFTLVEVMVALLLGAIGLLGTLAIQQAVVGASKAANDAAVALRLATQGIEESNSYTMTSATADQLAAAATGSWSDPVYLNAEGQVGSQPVEFRWIRRTRVTNLGPSLPYVISVVVTYNNESGTAKTVRLDVERRKTW